MKSRRKITGIRFEIFIFIIGIVLVSMISMGGVQYFSEINLLEQQIADKALVSIKPVLSLAARSIDGGNMMTLKNKAAHDIYSANEDLIYLRMSGTSAGTPKTDFFEAISPARIEYTYVREGFESESMNNLLNSIKDEKLKNEYLLDKKRNLLYLKKKLVIKNGGTVSAIYSAEVLDGLWFEVFKKVFFISLIILLGASTIAIFIGNRIANPIISVSRQITDITGTLNLNSEVKVNARNEIGRLANHFNEFIRNIRKLIGDFRRNAELVNSSAQSILTNSEKLNDVINSQSIQVEEVASSVEENSAAAQDISMNSVSAADNTTNVMEKVEEGSKVVGNTISEMGLISKEVNYTVSLMKELGESSEQISNILMVIQDIADQTNLLALNAAIEAARAGEHGRGFAVVADEVRKLSERTTLSTKEISDTIRNIQNNVEKSLSATDSAKKNVDKGVFRAQVAGESLENISNLVKEITGMITQIATSSEQQSSTTRVISENTQSVLEATNTVKDGMLVISNSYKELLGISETLQNEVAQFKIDSAESSVSS